MSKFVSNRTPDDPLEDALNHWANDSQGYRPLDAAAVGQPYRQRFAPTWRAAAALAAAALFVFALGQVSFTVSLGGASLQWGAAPAGDVDDLSARLADAESQLALFKSQLTRHAEAINTVAVRNALLGERLQAAAIELAQWQELESAARVYDMQNLAQLVTYEP